MPISTVAFSRLPPEKSNAASSLFNLARNLGASFGIATVTTLVVRQSQVHTNLLVAHAAADERRGSGPDARLVGLRNASQAERKKAVHSVRAYDQIRLERQDVLHR